MMHETVVAPKEAIPGSLTVPPRHRALTAEEFHRLSDTPPDIEWFANIVNPKTRRVYRIDIGQFMRFVGVERLGDLVHVARPHVIAQRMQQRRAMIALQTLTPLDIAIFS